MMDRIVAMLYDNPAYDLITGVCNHAHDRGSVHMTEARSSA